MSWNPSFLNELARQGQKSPRYVLESMIYGSSIPFGGQLRITSHDEGDGSQQCIARTGHSFTPAKLVPGEWSTTFGELRIALTGSVDIRSLPGYTPTRGQPVMFRIGFAGWSYFDYQPVFCGHLQEIGYRNGQWFVTVKSGMAALVNRFVSTNGQATLFYDFPRADVTTTTVFSANSSTTLSVTSTADWDHESPSGKYVLQITDNSGAQFWVTATGKTATQFTGISTSNFLGTFQGAAKSGSTVTPYFHMEDHPVNIARKIIASTGLALHANGDYDTLPASWGIGLTDDFLDHDDMDQTIQLVGPNSGGTNWNVIGKEAQEDGLSWMQSWLNPAGLFLTDYQGRISVRAALNSVNWHTDLEVVTDHDLVSIESYDTWDPNSPIEYDAFQGHIAGAAPSPFSYLEPLTSRPIMGARTLALDFIDQNASNWQTELRDRVGPWSFRVPEAVEIVTLGWRFAKLGPGSHLVISSKYFATRSHLNNEVFLVLSVQPDWFGSSTRIIASHIPADSDTL